MVGLKLIYAANILVAGWIGITSLFNPRQAALTIFSGAYTPNDTIKLVGALWLSIAVASVFGLWRPLTFSPVLLIQLVYKSTWLLVVALPAIYNKQPYPSGMAIFFLVWVLVLPFVIPWSDWLK